MGESLYDILRKNDEERNEMKVTRNDEDYSDKDDSADELAEDSQSSKYENLTETKVGNEPAEASEESAEESVEENDIAEADTEKIADESSDETIEELFGNESADDVNATVENVTGAEDHVVFESQGEQDPPQPDTSENGNADLKEQYNLRKFATFASKIDLDCTMPNLSSSEIADSAEQAKLFGLASVCTLASRMRMFKKQSAEQVFCAVIAYPSGEMTERSKICEIREAKSNGAEEIDVFFRISALKDEKRKNIIKSLKKYRFVIGKKKVFKLSIDSLLITNEESEFIVEAATAAKVDYLVVRNCALGDERTKLFFSGLCAGKLKLEFSDCITNLSSAEKLSAIGTDKFLLRDALAVAATMRDEINKE